MASGSVFATLCDINFVDQAKQLFSSLYYTSGWDGEYLLLSHNLPENEIAWFENKGILVKRCEPLYPDTVGRMSGSLASKLYLFTPEFKRWETIVYCDADSIVCGSLDGLKGLQGFNAVPEMGGGLGAQMISEPDVEEGICSIEQYQLLHAKIKESYDLQYSCFGAGFFVFDSSLIEEKTFVELRDKLEEIEPVSAFGEQLLFNLIFYNRWQALPLVYNLRMFKTLSRWKVPPEKLRGLIFHYSGPLKPWSHSIHYSEEWHANLKEADSIDLEKRPKGIIWSSSEIEEYNQYLLKKASDSTAK